MIIYSGAGNYYKIISLHSNKIAIFDADSMGNKDLSYYLNLDNFWNLYSISEEIALDREQRNINNIFFNVNPFLNRINFDYSI